MIAILTTPAIAGIAFLGTKSALRHDIFLQIYVRFVPDPMGSDAENTLASKKFGKNVI